jgi:catechol 2,3-dioxygenase-like lactoylglutathione lyase family enzyme
MANEKSKGCKFHHVAINVQDYEKSVNFYKALGMKVYLEFDSNDGNQHCFMDVGDGPYLELHSTKETDLRETRMQHFCFHVDDVDAVYELAMENGAAPKVPPFPPQVCPLNSTPKPIPNARVAHFYGPDGESVEIINWYGFKI